jgi:hypothetical protein
MPFTLRSYVRFLGMTFVVCLFSLSSMVGADSLWSGTWVLRDPPQGGHLTITLEEVALDGNSPTSLSAQMHRGASQPS